MKFHYIQSSLADINAGKNARKRFDELTIALAEIGATFKLNAMTHDDVHIEIDCPIGCEADAQAILDRHFPR